MKEKEGITAESLRLAVESVDEEAEMTWESNQPLELALEVHSSSSSSSEEQ